MCITLPFLSKDMLQFHQGFVFLLFAWLVYCSAFLRLQYCSKQSPNCRGFINIIYNSLTLHDACKSAVVSLSFLSFWSLNWERRTYVLCHFLGRGRRAKEELCDSSYNFGLRVGSLIYIHIPLGQSRSTGSGSRPLPQEGVPGENFCECFMTLSSAHILEWGTVRTYWRFSVLKRNLSVGMSHRVDSKKIWSFQWKIPKRQQYLCLPAGHFLSLACDGINPATDILGKIQELGRSITVQTIT